MDLVAGIRKEGSRGGRGDFKWEDVRDSQHRENYLGHSLMARTSSLPPLPPAPPVQLTQPRNSHRPLAKKQRPKLVRQRRHLRRRSTQRRDSTDQGGGGECA